MKLSLLQPFTHVTWSRPTLATPCAPTLEDLELSFEDFSQQACSLDASGKLFLGQLARTFCVLGEGVYRIEGLEGIGCGSGGNEDE